MTTDEEILATLKRMLTLQESEAELLRRSMEMQEQAFENQKRAIETAESMKRFSKRIALVGLILIVAVIALGVAARVALGSN
jgi:hypothetical protein